MHGASSQRQRCIHPPDQLYPSSVVVLSSTRFDTSRAEHSQQRPRIPSHVPHDATSRDQGTPLEGFACDPHPSPNHHHHHPVPPDRIHHLLPISPVTSVPLLPPSTRAALATSSSEREDTCGLDHPQCFARDSQASPAHWYKTEAYMTCHALDPSCDWKLQ